MTINEFQPDYLDVAQEGDVTVARFTVPRLTEEVNLDQLGYELFALVDQLDCRRLVVSLQDIEYITSSGLGKLIALHRKMHREKGQIVFCQPQPPVTQILHTSKLDTYFVITESIDRAVEAARQQP